MANRFGKHGKERGDELVYSQLSKLSNRFVIFAQPSIHAPEKSMHPDYVVIDKEKGILVLEVKDWVDIVEVTEDQAVVQSSNGGEKLRLTSPVEQARNVSFGLRELLGRYPHFINHYGKYRGKLKFPVCYAGFLPHQPKDVIEQIEPCWGFNSLFGKPELDSLEILRSKLDSYPYPFRIRKEISKRCFNALHKILKPHVRINNEGFEPSLPLAFSGV